MQDTIYALSTPPGSGGIAVIRVSGGKAAEVLGSVFCPAGQIGEWEANRLYYGRLVDGKETVDQVMAVLMRAPRSYTGEEMAEIHCHGGVMPVRRTLALLSKYCDRPAQPGEFTRRAFLNGKMDLAEAEAVMSYIGSVSEEGARNAQMQLNGALSREIQRLEEELLDLTAYIEAVIEYPEEDFEEIPEEEMKRRLTSFAARTDELISSYLAGRILTEGLKVAIVGRPNVGKSTLLNALTREDKAIVTDIPGTTRDVIEGVAQIHGIPVRFFDTAGMRDTQDAVERIGVERSKSMMQTADVVMYVVDASSPLSPEDEEMIGTLKNAFIVLNKLDRQVLKAESLQRFGFPVLTVSAKTGENMQALYEKIASYAGEQPGDGLIITSERQRNVLTRTRGHVSEALEALSSGMPLDVVSIDLAGALSCLAELTGKQVSGEIVDEIFSNFCLGK